jgi:hypothetical protein
MLLYDIRTPLPLPLSLYPHPAEKLRLVLFAESYLIKPIQRILKYPLLLLQLKVRVSPDMQPYHSAR